MGSKKTWILSFLGVLGLAGILALAIILNNQAPEQSSGSSSQTSDGTLDIDNGDLKIDWSRYSKYELDLSASSTIAKAGVYHVTGELDGSPLIINAGEDKVKIILDNVTIKNSTGPAIACYSADDLVVELVGENILRDGNKYDSTYDDDVKGAIYSKADLTFGGSGSLILTANYQDGIVSKDDLKFNSGNFTITAADDAIRGKDSVYIVDGDFNITSRSDAIKSTNDSKAGKGFVLIENGHIKIAAGDDAIHAETSLLIYDGNIDITKSYEGLEASQIVINSGTVSIVSSDDGINAASGATDTTTQNTMGGPGGPGGMGGGMGDTNENNLISINGGTIYINASGDGIDSNGYIYINGGLVTVDGPTDNGNGALDAGLGIIAKGGTLIAVGASGMAEAPNNSSTISSVSIFFDANLPAGTKVKIKDSDGTTILRHTSAKSFNHMVATTADFATGETYTIYIDDSVYDEFTISDVTTVVGNGGNNFNNNFAPGQGGPGGQNIQDAPGAQGGPSATDSATPPDFPDGATPPDGNAPMFR